MVLGIDVGGTHTDAVCVDKGTVVSSAKTLTGSDLVASISNVIEGLGIDCRKVQRVTLSTTLCTNAIVERKHAPVGMICSAGPGLDPALFAVGPYFKRVSGAIDHRGREFAPIKREEVWDAAQEIRKAGCPGVGVVSKFSVRNPSHEKAVAEIIGGLFDFVCLGHTISGSLNFPRRINSTYLNAAVMPVQERFVKSVGEAMDRMGIRAPLFFLKADGGTYTAEAASRLPVETILSGPAASMMGGIALDGVRSGCAFIVDIGGTTTDIGVVVNGVPLIEPGGVAIDGLKTLVRGMRVTSVGVGGDSVINATGAGGLAIGPVREGLPACLGGPCPTPMDALAVLGAFRADAQAARSALEPGAKEVGMDVFSFSQKVVETMSHRIKDAAESFLADVNAHPVYTIHEMLHPDVLVPDRVILIGGPADLLKDAISRVMGLPVHVPDHAGVANALGAALARTTAQITLHADTEMKRLVCPELGIEQEIPRTMDLEELKALGIRAMAERAASLGLADEFDAQVIEESTFTMVRGFSTVGKNMRVRIQTRPGLIREWEVLP